MGIPFFCGKALIIMKRSLLILLHSVIVVNCFYSQINNGPESFKGPLFQENLGQVYNQFYESRPDILFSGSSEGLNFHLKKNGISYQLSKLAQKSGYVAGAIPDPSNQDDSREIYRIDLTWQTGKSCVIEKHEPIQGSSNFYYAHCSNGVTGVKNYRSVMYKNIYDQVDLKWYVKNNELEYDYIVHPGGNYGDIKIDVSGAKSLHINKKGELEIETPLGTIIEKAPKVYQDGTTIGSYWVLSGNKISFVIDNYDKEKDLIIDPVVRVWGTYYGEAGNDNMMDTKTDATGNVYITGYANGSANLATVGSHQTFVAGLNDCLLIKFNSIGVRQWATYYGGTGNDFAYGCAVAPSGDVYMGGSISVSNASLVTATAHQAVIGGGTMDGFLAKFNSTGVRQWATYYGGSGDELIYGCTTDAFGNIFISGRTTSTNNIATASGFQTNYLGGTTDGFMAKFSPGGVRRWATYYGSSGTDETFRSCTDATGKVFFAGYTAGTGTLVSTPGTHQTVNGGGGNVDAYLVKFDSVGVRQWATLYGGLGSDYGRACAIDGAGDVYLTGYVPFGTTSTIVATAGAFQTNGLGGSTEGYLVKFNSTGIRQWGTYISTIANDYLLSCQFDGGSGIYVAGYTNVVTAANVQMSTPGSHQTVIGGLNDGFVNKFNLAGVRQWGTYYGGTQDDYIQSSCVSSSGAIYITGSTSSPTGISTAGAHQTALNVATDGYLAQLKDCAGTTFSISGTTGSICAGQTLTLTGVGTGISTYSWSTGPTTNSIVVSPTAAVVYSLSGTTSTLGCNYLTSISVSIAPSPTITISATNYSICSGNTVILTAAGAVNYTWYPGNNAATSILISPTSSSNYTVIGNSGGCGSTATVGINVTTTPTLVLSSIAPVICAGNSTLMNAYGATTYSWSTGATTQSVSLSPSVTTSYSVIGFNGACSNTATLQLTVNPNPTVSVNSQSTCPGGTATLVANGANTYSWTGGPTTASYVTSPTITTNYTVVGTNTFGCSHTATTSVVISPSLGIILNASANTLCTGGQLTLTANGAITYTWSNLANGSSIIDTPTTSTTYSVNGSSGPCFGASTIAIIVNPLPQISAAVNPTLVCVGDAATLSVNGAVSYTWNPGSAMGSVINVTPTVTTNYTVVGTDANGCSNSSMLNVVVDQCVGVSEISRSFDIFRIYPNPSSGKVTVDINSKQGYLMLLDLAGKWIYRTDLSGTRSDLDLSFLSKGIYLAKVIVGSETYHVKLVIE